MIVLGSAFEPIMERLVVKIAPFATLQRYEPTAPVAAQLANVDAMVIGMAGVGEKELAAAPKLRLLQQHGRGVDSVDLTAAAAADVAVANVPGGNSVAVAEQCLALMLSLAKRLPLAGRSVADRVVGSPATIELMGKTVLIVGLGASGVELARVTGAMGMRILATKGRPEIAPEIEVAALAGPEALHEFLPQADFVILMTTLNETTRHMIGADELSLMKPGGYLINAARGPLADHDALLSALRTGQIAGAGFDTFWKEPADPDDPILALENFTLTPHVAGFTDISIDHVTDVMAENFRRVTTGEPFLNVLQAG